MSKQIKNAIFLFVLSFTAYVFFQFPGFQGYEDETYNRIVTNLSTGEFKTARSGYAQTLLETPFVWKGRILDSLLNIQHGKTAQLFALFYNPFITALSVAVMFLIFSLYVGKRKAFWLTLVYAFGTMAFPYASIGMEPTAVLLVLLSVYFLFKFGGSYSSVILAPCLPAGRKARIHTNKYLVLSGLFYFLLLFSKAYYFVTGLAFIAYLCLLAKEFTPPVPPFAKGGTTSPQTRGGKNRVFSPSNEGESHVRRGEGVDFKKFIKFCFLFAAPLLLILPLYLLANKYNFGVYFGGQYKLSDELFGGENPIFGIYGLLLSFGKSVFIYVPALILSVILFPRFYRKHPKEVIFTLVYSASLILFISQIHWWSDETWGPRYLLSLSAIGLLPLLSLKKVDFVGIKKVFFIFLISASFLIQLLGAWARYDVFPYSFYEIYGATKYNVLASQEYQYIPQFAPYFVNYQLIKNKILGRNEPLKYEIVYSPPMEKAATDRGDVVTEEIIFDNNKYQAHALNFWWMNVPGVPTYKLLGIFILIFGGLGWWGRILLKSAKNQSTK